MLSHGKGAAVRLEALQGIICFESVMAQARDEGHLTEEMPICCKPDQRVRLLKRSAT